MKCSRCAELEQELTDTETLATKLSNILTETAKAIKGEPPELTQWSYHDLPEQAAALKAELATITTQGIEYAQVAEDLREELKALKESGEFNAGFNSGYSSGSERAAEIADKNGSFISALDIRNKDIK